MADTLLAPHLVDCLKESAKEVLETMVSMTPRAVEQVSEPDRALTDEVIGLLGFTGTRSGTFVVRSDLRTACTIAARMLMMEPEELTDLSAASDAFGEVVNMIGGNFKNAWVAEGNQMDLSVPNVILDGQVRPRGLKAGTVRPGVRVVLDEGVIHIGVHFEA